MSDRRYTYLAGEDILLFKRRYTAFWKKTHRLWMSSWMGSFMLLLLTLTACVGEELQKPLLGEGEGYLTLQIGAISAEVTTSPLTKTPTPLDASLVPSIGQLTINIKNKNTQEVVFTANPTGETITKVLKTGTYIVEAYHGTDNDIQETPYFYDSKEVTVESLQMATTTIVAKLANAMITPVVSESLSKHYQSYTVTAKVNGSTLVFPSGKSLFAAAGKTISLTFTGTNQLGVETSYTTSATEALQAGKNYLLQCDPEFSKCSSIQVNATIDPIIEDGWLTGSNVLLSYNSPDGAQIKNISSWHVEISYGGNTIRTYDSSSAPNSTIMETKADWPYVPQKSEITAYVVIEGDHIPVEAHTTVNPIPSKVIEITGTTSYDKYLAKNISGANEMNAETIEGIGAKAKISEDLLSKFSHSFSLTYENIEYDPDTDCTITVGTKTGLSWGNHPITATMVFDGHRIEAKKDCHITGLPYSAKPPKEAEWSGNAKDWGSEYVRLHAHTISKTFYTPADIDINVYHKVNVRTGTVETTYQFIVSGNKIETKSPAYNSWEYINNTYSPTLKSSNPVVQCTNSYGNSGPLGTRAEVYEVTITYK